MYDQEILKIKLKEYEEEHSDLDEIIHRLHESKTISFMQLKRLKKRKLILRDQILKIKNELEPDIIA